MTRKNVHSHIDRCDLVILPRASVNYVFKSTNLLKIAPLIGPSSPKINLFAWKMSLAA